jgi:hypothetical protein
MLSIQGGMPPASGVSLGARSLSETQKQGLDDLLSSYDAETLSDDDAKSLVEGIKDLDIQPGSALSGALGAAGFDARALATQAGIAGERGGPGRAEGPGGGGGGPGGAQGAKGPDSAAVQTLQSVLEQLEQSASETDSDEEFGALLTQALQEAGLDPSQSILDYHV